MLLIGLGGGALAGWLLSHLTDLEELVACEVDPVVARVAREFFMRGTAHDPRLTIHEGDGLEYARKAGSTFDAVLVDASESAGSREKGSDQGVWAPPRALRLVRASRGLSVHVLR